MAHGIVEPAPRHAYIGQRDGAPERIGNVSNLEQARLALNIKLVGRGKIPACPCRQAQEPGGRTLTEMVV